MKNAPSTKLSDLAYLIVLSLLIIFLLLATASLWRKDIPHQRLLLSALLFGLGYLACLFLSKLIFSPLGRLIRRSTNPVRDKSLNGVTRKSAASEGRETANAGSSLRQLTEDLRLSREEAKRWNRELEHRVEERTRELSEAQERLIQSARLASLGEMASCIAHEIRNPLAIIATAGGYLKRDAADKPAAANESSQVEEQLGIIDTETVRVSRIIDGLLRFSRISTSSSHPKLVNINEMVEDALSQAVQGRGLRGIEVVKELTSSLPGVKIDPAELQQAFLNIIQNAVQAMPNGGNLTIVTKPGVEPNCLEISFTDTGCGMAEENIEKVFHPFFTSKDFGEGTGLGLAIAEGIVKRAGGKIKAESKLGKGTVFTVYLPIGE